MGKDLGQLNTQAINPSFSKIDTLATLELLKLFNASDKSVPVEVKKVLPKVAEVITAISKLPLIALYLILSEQFFKGLTAGAVKG